MNLLVLQLQLVLLHVQNGYYFLQQMYLYQDAAQTIERLKDPSIKKITVIGAGYIGVELASGLSITLPIQSAIPHPKKLIFEFLSVIELDDEALSILFSSYLDMINYLN